MIDQAISDHDKFTRNFTQGVLDANKILHKRIAHLENKLKIQTYEEVERFVHEYERQKFSGTVGVFHFFNEWKNKNREDTK